MTPAPTPPGKRRRHSITLARFWLLERALRTRGFGDEIALTEHPMPLADARAFASEAIYVVINSGMRASVALAIHERCMVALHAGVPVGTVYGHAGKARAIETIWRDRETLFSQLQATDDLLAFCAALPFIGPVTMYHLAKIAGGNHVKPDVHLTRLADTAGTSAWRLCQRLARATGYREATIDTVLWRACEQGLIDSLTMREVGWAAATVRLHSAFAVDAQPPFTDEMEKSDVGQ